MQMLRKALDEADAESSDLDLIQRLVDNVVRRCRYVKWTAIILNDHVNAVFAAIERHRYLQGTVGALQLSCRGSRTL